MSFLSYLRYFTGWEPSPAIQSPYADVKDIARYTLEPFEPPPLNTDLPLPILPPEIVELIVRYAARPLLPPDHASYGEYLKIRKQHWKRLGGVVSSTKYYRQLLVKKWFAVVVLHEPSDWGRVLSQDWMGGLEPVIWSLEVLEILNAHGPDEHIIKLASQCCPNLTELRLGRCTMFNNRNCVWWKAHPADHDAYMADRGVEAYAGAVGNLIENMPKLRVLHIGVYLTPIEAVWAHRVDHRRLHPIPDVMRHENPEGIHNHLHHVALAAANGEDPEPPVNYHYPPLAKQEIWDAPCSECDKHFKVPAENAEMRTACVLSARVWSLRTISFVSFTSPGRVGLSTWEVRPRHSADDRLLDGEDANVMLPQLGQENPPIRHIKVDVGRLEDGDFVKRKHLIYEISRLGDSIILSPPINEPSMAT
ncbi:hypothetical protein FRC11_013728, partial [Ceratobasidium sp. 423]